VNFLGVPVVFDPFGLFAFVVVGFQMWLFYPYFKAMFRYRTSGRMDAESDEVLKFMDTWLGGKKD